MTIRPIHSFELPACIRGGHEFFAEANLPGGFNEAHFLQTWNELVESGDGFVLGMFHIDGSIIGALAAVESKEMFSGIKIATECFWFVHHGHRGHGIALLDAFEKQARERGCAMTSMIHLMALQPEKLGALYERRGYKEIERHWVKGL